MKLLITSGATREPIDGVRFISNFSSGRTGAALAEFFVELGFEVTYLRGEGAHEPSSRCQSRGFTDFGSLNDVLKNELGRESFYAVIHLAAVSDYSVGSIGLGDRFFSPRELHKIDSHDSDELKLILKRNFKIVNRLKSYAEGRLAPRVIAFKLTNSSDAEAAQRAVARVFAGGGVDAVVHNDLAQMKDGSGIHRFTFFRSHNGKLGRATECEGVDELGTAMVEWFRENRGES